MAEYTKAPESLLSIARTLIDEVHFELKEANIGFLFRDEAQVSKGKVILGTAKKAPRWVQPYANLDFLIIIAKDEWDRMQQTRRIALIDHKLCHLIWDDGEPKIKGHDIEEFHEIIDRHGLWNFDLYHAKKLFEKAQKPMKCFEPPKREGKVSTIEKVITTKF